MISTSGNLIRAVLIALFLAESASAAIDLGHRSGRSGGSAAIVGLGLQSDGFGSSTSSQEQQVPESVPFPTLRSTSDNATEGLGGTPGFRLTGGAGTSAWLSHVTLLFHDPAYHWLYLDSDTFIPDGPLFSLFRPS